MSDILPLFSSAASLKQGGIFTVDKAGYLGKAGRKRGPVSLCDLAKQEKLTQLHLVDSTFVNFFSAYKNLKEVGCDLAFGLKVVVCEDMADKSEESFKTESKVIVFMKSGAGYQPLCSLYSKAAKDGFYYIPRIDWKTLRKMWSEHFILALPFYSSFLAKNTLTFATISPDLPATPVALKEVNQQLPVDELLNDAVARYSAATGCPIQPAKSIYYKDRKDAKAFQIWRCILSRGATFDKPGMDGMCSREFCYEAYKELSADVSVHQ